ncbi:DUF4293 domain-containing protein [Lewinella sp. W8]|uniref:DUF4293 domain-containing protein n=1 Tax=Lewinella sp. W8 TaxID=2528208 RepID=UPI0010673EA9|nr:DUF4293 domain-containing protein [Lewinella sp. W8]MTB49497.1 DUF4293 family protein [Lewinella sp. W8]
MLQRIQSVFLFLAALACFGLFATDAADTDRAMADSNLFADGSFNIFDDPVLMGAFTLAGVLLLVVVFLYKNRPLQMKLSLAAVVVVLFGLGYGVFLWLNDLAGKVASPDVGIVLPVLAIILALLGRRYVKQDEQLVRSADRLR